MTMLLLAGGCFSLGMIAGWWLHASAYPPPNRATLNASETKEPFESTSLPRATALLPATPVVPVAAKAQEGSGSMAARLKFIKDLAANKSYYNFDPFIGQKLNPSFVLLMNLTVAEVKELEAAMVHAQQAYAEAGAREAVVEMGADGRSMTVEVPPLPQASGVIYDQVLGVFSAVLGPERFEVFNVASRDNFERDLGDLGLKRVTYHLQVMPPSPGEREAMYEVKTTYKSVDDRGNWSNTGQVTASLMKGIYPLLSRLLPPNFGESPHP